MARRRRARRFRAGANRTQCRRYIERVAAEGPDGVWRHDGIRQARERSHCTGRCPATAAQPDSLARHGRQRAVIAGSAVRGMLLLRAQSLSLGFSGIRYVEVIELLIGMLNHGLIHPIIPSQGSVGASGDLRPLAHIGGARADRRRVRSSSATPCSPAGGALEEVGLTPVTLDTKRRARADQWHAGDDGYRARSPSSMPSNSPPRPTSPPRCRWKR